MQSLFSSLFPATDKSAWLAQVQKELKDANAYESLHWHTGEGFTLEPYYTSDDLSKLPIESIQAAQKQQPGWQNAPEQQITDEKADNLRLRDAITRGADALVLALPTNPDLSRLLNGIKLSDTPVFFRLQASSTNVADFVQALKTVAPYQLKGGLLMDVDHSTAEATRLTADSPLFRTVCISSHAFHNAGATAIQELAFTLGSLADAYDKLTDEGLTIDQLVPKTMLSISVGTSYFLEIAQLRALRVLLSRFLAAYHSSFIIHHSSFLHAQTSTFYDSTATPYTNLLRATTEAMAAVIGGCDALTVHSYDTVLGKTTSTSNQKFADRIARNVSILLKDESYLDAVADPSAGSYYIENITHTLVEAAWVLFLDVEKRGGLVKALASGFIQNELERSYLAKVEAVRNGKVLVGVTKFRSDESTDPVYGDSKDFIGLLPNRRLAGEFE